MIFLEREGEEQEDGVVVGVGCSLAEQLLPLISTEKVHAVAKSTPWQSPRRGKVHAVQSANSSLWKEAKSYHAVRSPRCPKSDGVKKKKKVKIWQESDSIGLASQRPRTRPSGRVP